MREILYRAKSTERMIKPIGDWVHGYYVCMNGKHKIYNKDFPMEGWSNCRVDSETVGQYTGIDDINGVKIFEGDIVNLHYFYTNYNSNTLGRFEDEKTIKAKISFGEMGVLFESVCENKFENGYLCDYLEDPSEELEVIGNIYDNPEQAEAIN